MCPKSKFMIEHEVKLHVKKNCRESTTFLEWEGKAHEWRGPNYVPCFREHGKYIAVLEISENITCCERLSAINGRIKLKRSENEGMETTNLIFTEKWKMEEDFQRLCVSGEDDKLRDPMVESLGHCESHVKY